MRIIIALLSVFFLVSCKKEGKDCQDKFQDLYLKRQSLWFDFEKVPGKSYDNFSQEQYLSLRKQTNDSLDIMIDCAIDFDRKNEILYLYKMKQLFLADRLSEVEGFYRSVDKNLFKQDIYFQLSLFNTLVQELRSGVIQKDVYMKLKNNYLSEHLDVNYSERATMEFLDYLIDNDLHALKMKMEKKYSDTMPFEWGENRRLVIEDIMIRGDNLVFD